MSQGVAILTSGGDAPGMNAAVRAVIRYLTHYRTPVFCVWEGYEGLCRGGESIKEMKWKDALGILSKGGTMIGTARSAEFRTREGRKRAAANLVNRKINSLVVIGGDGSLIGASIFKREWPDLVMELREGGVVSEENATACSYLNIAGMVGSIDNDLCGTDMTIGTDSALHRIVDAIDCLASTASSHMRTFIVEVMGRHCGYLALMSAIAVSCDWVFIPEAPPESDWEERIVRKMQIASSSSKRFGLVIIAEGAADCEGNPISAEYVKKVFSSAGMDVRTTVLGHVQRGGRPTAFDRTLGSRLGCEAAKMMLEGRTKEIDPCIISLKSNQIIRLPLMGAIERTLSVKECFKSKDFAKAQELRGPSFAKKVEMSKMLSVMEVRSGDVRSGDVRTGEVRTGEERTAVEGGTQLNIGVVFIGAPAPGMNSGVRALVKIAAYHGHVVTVYHEGVDGILTANHEVVTPEQCELWNLRGGCVPGATRTTINSDNIDRVIASFTQLKLSSLVIFGGFEAVTSCLNLCDRTQIPVYLVPSTISNNVPGTDFSVGCDTALNSIVQSVDTIKQSAASTRKRVFIIDVMGGNCGYLAVVSGLASGADAVYIPEQPVNIDDLQCDAYRVMEKIAQGIHRGIIIRNENSSPNYKNDFVTAIYEEEGKDKFVTRSSILGHIQQGYSPSPFDRVLAATFACKVYRDLVNRVTKPQITPDDVLVIGIQGGGSHFTPLRNLEMDMARRVPTKNWWLELVPLIQTLALPPNITDGGSVTGNCSHCVRNHSPVTM